MRSKSVKWIWDGLGGWLWTDDWTGWVWQDNGDNLVSSNQVRYKTAYTDTLSDNIHVSCVQPQPLLLT